MTLPLQTYLAEMHRLWSTGVATGELSYYTPLQNLFNELGRTLKPKVFCLSNPKDTGAGHPDFYFFTANQLRKAKSLREPIPDAPPERGVVEAKRATADVRKRVETKQVSDYLRYVRDTSRRIASILLLQPALDANYRAIIADTYEWPRD